jgi:acetaldehyde dehydrogenase (acetylating)
VDKDLQAIQEVRALVAKAKQAQPILAAYSQEEVDNLVTLMAERGYRASRELAQLACEETGFGRVESKIEKNIFATRDVYEGMKDVKTVGIIHEDQQKQVYEVAAPMGIVAAIIPVTNPTSTTLFKILICIKARCTIILSPHPKAVKCIQAAAEVMMKAADSIGAPEGLIGCLSIGDMAGAHELMTHPDVDVILATGGAAMVKAAYSSGKPAIGVGPGNCPAFIERTANIPHSVRCLILSKSFDWSTICSSEQSVILDEPIEQQCLEEFRRQGAYMCNDKEIRALEHLMPPGGAINPEIVGKSPVFIAQKAGFKVPEDTLLLLARQQGVGDRYPLSREKLSPLLSLYTENGWEEACERSMEILHYGGMGHTLVIHSRNQEIISAFALKKPAFRILVNAPSSQGAIGYATNLPQSLTLGCGALGRNITSDNITCRHLLNIKRIAFGKPSLFKDIATPHVSLSSESKKETPIYRRDPFIPKYIA